MVTTNTWEKLRRPEGKILSPIKSIRKHCIECMGGQVLEVRECTAPECWLYPHRMGKDAARAKPSAKQIEAGRQLSARLRSREA